METVKICRFLIVIFLVLTVFFAVMYFNELNNKTYVSKEFVESAVENLNSQGIELSADIIETKIPDEDIYVLSIDDINVHNSKLIDAIVSSVYDFDVVKSVFDVPEGSSVGIYSADDSKRELARVFFSANDMSFNFTKNGVNISGSDYPVMNELDDGINEEKKSIMTAILKKVVSGNGIDYRFSGCTGSEDLVIISAIQTINGYDINNIFMNFIFDGEELVAVTGNWFYGNQKAKYHEKLVDGVNVLYMLDVKNVKAIHSERIIYTLRKTDNTYFLIPGWLISYTDTEGNHKSSYFDAL